jgi:outer membrane receptor protein involved in Fe transport
MRPLAALALSLAIAVPSFAQKQIGEVTLFGEEQLKVEAATKTEIPLSKAPASVTVITAKQIRESGARTTLDLLRFVAGVNARWNPMTQTIDIRGFGENPFSNRVLLLIDGAPYNSGDTGGFPLSPAYDFFPVENIKRIEVVRGPGSSLYGENAFWGVINVVTLSGEDLAGGDLQLYGGSLSTGAVSAVWGQKFASGSIIGGVKVEQTQFPEELWLDDGSKMKSTDLFLKATRGDWQVSAYKHDDRMSPGFDEALGPAVGLPPTTAFRSSERIVQTLDSFALRYNHAPQSAPITYSADLSYAHRNGMHCAGCHAAQQAPQFSRRANHGYQAIGDFRAGLHMFPGHDVLLGIEARRLDRAEHKAELDSTAQAASGYDKVAFYAQDQFDAIKDRLRIVAGLRYDQKTKLFESKTSPRLAFVYTPSNRLVLRGGYSTAFRFPTFSELYQASWFLTVSSEIGIPPFPLSVFKPNPTLKPEEISTFDVGGEYQISPNVSAKADLYRSRLKNFIVIVQHFNVPPVPSSLGWENQPADARITGGELELRANFTSGVTGFVNVAHQSEGQIGPGVDTSGNPFEFVYSPKNKINAGAYVGPFNGVRASIEAAWKGEYEYPRDWALIRSGFTDPTTKPVPGYTMLDARVSYDLPLATKRPIRLSVFGNNLLDKHPDETILGAPNLLAGRQVFGQVEIHF